MQTQLSPFTLAYGVEAILSLEVQIPSLHVDIQEGLTTDENHKI